MDFELNTHYWDDSEKKAAFKTFIHKIHNLDFTLWESAGYWDDAYTPFSFFKEGKVVSSVCVYLLKAVIHGRKTCLAQISGVGTLPEWRNKGLNRQLTEMGLKWAQNKHEGVFFYADTGAIPFYKKCGFTPLEDYKESLEIHPCVKQAGLKKLNPDNIKDLDKIYSYARKRTPLSDKFSVLNAKLVMFHVLYDLPDCIYEIPDLDCIIFFRRKNGLITIYDILSKSIPSLNEFYPYISKDTDRRIEMHFSSDKLNIDKKRTHRIHIHGNNVFTKGIFPVSEPVFPYTAKA